MRYDFSPGLEQALARARQWARAAGGAAVAPLHLFQALIEDDERSAWNLLARAGLPRDRVLAVFLADLPAADLAADHLVLAAATHAALARALELVHQGTDELTLTTDHLLLALLESETELESRLEDAGLDFAAVQRALVPTPPTIPLEELAFTEPTDVLGPARVLDANANRAREALRVLEDHCRFQMDDAFLSRQLKELRHDLAGALELLPTGWLLEARDTTSDVGTGISTPGEMDRASSDDVLAANAKRLQEALRCLEEFGKVVRPEFARAVEQLRYRGYTLERALRLTEAARDRLAEAWLYVLVTESLCRHSLVGTVAEALAGGAHVIQLREKDADGRRLLDKAREVRKLTRQAGALFIVNDRPDIARLAQADGVHLGQDDLPVRAARHILGPGALIGVSTHNLDQVRQAVTDGASYLGVGPTFPSKTKSFDALAGLEFVRQAAAETSLPAFALGGITLENLAEVLAAGGRRVAVSQAICGADDPRTVTRAFRQQLDNELSADER